MQTRIPQHFLNLLEPIKDDDAAVREVGTNLIADLCRKILENGILQLHFYTMNLEKATFMILEKMEITTAMNLKNPLPWRQVKCLTNHY
jgi:methylenetetrahydrofolate reductase (NADPH)